MDCADEGRVLSCSSSAGETLCTENEESHHALTNLLLLERPCCHTHSVFFQEIPKCLCSLCSLGLCTGPDPPPDMPVEHQYVSDRSHGLFP